MMMKAKKRVKKLKTEQVNDAKAFWTRSKSEIKDKEYKEFYKSFTSGF